MATPKQDRTASTARGHEADGHQPAETSFTMRTAEVEPGETEAVAGDAVVPGRQSLGGRLKGSNLAIKIASFAALLLAWYALSAWFGAFLMPGPIEVADRLVNVVLHENFLGHMGATLYRVLVGLVISLFIAVAVGIPMGLFRVFERFFESYVLLGLTIPGLAWALIAVMVFGINNWAPIFAIVVSTAPMVILNMWQGTKSIDRDVLEMSDAFQAGRWLSTRHVVFPQLMPFVLAGTRLGFALAWKIVVLSEMFGLSSGVGYALNINFSRFSLSGVMAWTIAFTLVMALFEFGLFRPIERHVTRWRPNIQGG